MPDRDPVDDLLARSAGVEIPTGVEARMREQFRDFRARVDGRPGRLHRYRAWLAGPTLLRWSMAGTALAAVVAIVFFSAGSRDGGRVYAAAVSRLAGARSVQYTVEVAPFVSIELSYLAPSRQRIMTSFGIEIRADGSGTQLVLLHASKQYVLEKKKPASGGGAEDLIEQLRSLPRSADATLGERSAGGRRLLGYRIKGTSMPGQHGVETLDLWLDAETGAPDHVDITPTGAGTSGYQMHIRDIRVDAALDPAPFDMTPPVGYSEATAGAASERLRLR